MNFFFLNLNKIELLTNNFIYDLKLWQTFNHSIKCIRERVTLLVLIHIALVQRIILYKTMYTRRIYIWNMGRKHTDTH